jgi:hypothetical protein
MDYKVIKSRRRTISLEIRDSQIVVRAPLFLPRFAIAKFVQDRSDWISKHLARQLDKSTLGEDEIMIGGEPIRLEFSSGRDGVMLKEGKLIVSTVGSLKKLQILKLKHFLIRLTQEKVLNYLKTYQIDFETDFNFTVRIYKSKWGSCSHDDKLTFNGKLAMTDEKIIEYVVVHELCHTKEKNHSRGFWRLVENILPDYKKRRKWLRDNHHLLDYENR